MVKLKKWDKVYIEWTDITGEGPNWSEDKDDDLIPAECKTVGFVLQHNKKFIKICGSYSSEHVSDKTVIPRGCISKIELLDHLNEPK